MAQGGTDIGLERYWGEIDKFLRKMELALEGKRVTDFRDAHLK